MQIPKGFTIKKRLIAVLAVVVLASGIVFIWQALSCGSEVIMAPDYAYEMLESTQVEWQLEDGKIGGGAKINYPSDPAHEYETILSIVSDNGQKFIGNFDGLVMIQSRRLIGWSDMDESVRRQIDWSTAHIWCEVRIYDEKDNVIFHGIKKSKPFTEPQITQPLIEVSLLQGDQ